MAARSHSLGFAVVVSAMVEDYFLRDPKTDLGRIFEGKYAGKHFCERKVPNQGTYMGVEIAQPPSRCAPPHQNERVETSGP